MTSRSALIGEHAGVPAPDPPSPFDWPRSRARAAVSDLRSGLQRCRLLRSSWVASGETRPRPGEPSEAWRGHGALGGGGSWSTEEPHWPTPALGPALPLSVPHRSRTVRNTRLSLRASAAQDSRRPWEPFSLPRALPIQSTLPTWGAFPSARWASGPPGLGAPLTTAPTDRCVLPPPRARRSSLFTCLGESPPRRALSSLLSCQPLPGPAVTFRL